MKNESANSDSPLSDEAESQFQQLLSDAYDIPAMPRSLLKRLDRTVEAEWGNSPRLVASPVEPIRRAFSASVPWARWPQLAAGLAVAIALVMVFRGDRQAYGWAAMLQALAEQGIVQIETDGGWRWLSLDEGLLGARTRDGLTLVDVRQRIVLERQPNGQKIERRRLPGAPGAWDRNRLALAWLLNDTLATSAADERTGIHLIDENWKSVMVNDREQISLRVTLQSSAFQRIELALALDPATHLPISCELPGAAGAAQLAFSYPSERVAERREQDFPAHLAVIDVNDERPPAATVADNTTTSVGKSADNGNAASIARSATQSVAEAPPGQTPMFGAPATWKPVVAAPLPPGEVVAQIDAVLAELWKAHEITPVEPADDAELLRRVYLDLVGRTPSVNEARSYLNDASPHRYEALVDRLLTSPDHASHIATVWRTFLIPEGVDLARFGGVEAFDKWLAERLATNDGYDEVVRSLLLAEGRLSRSGPLLFYSALKLDADQLASRTARVFLGMRLECAQCHDHPFEPWTQRDFWSFAAFFARISRPQAELQTVSTVMQVRDVDHGEVMLPDTEVTVPPKFLNEAAPAELAAAARREELARWLTSGHNPYFARATANRIWGHLFGKGIVDPIDDFGTKHAPKSPELLELLAGHFIQTKFSLRELFRAVALSRAYRLSSGAATLAPERLEWFAQQNVKTLTAEQVFDCITVATLLDTAPAADPNALSVARFGNSARDEFIRQFRTPTGHSTEYLAGIPQALTLMNGSLIDSATGLSTSGLLKSLEAPLFSNRQRIEVLYLATLSRRPGESECALLDDYISDDATGAELQEGLADLLWALLNSAEFTLNH